MKEVPIKWIADRLTEGSESARIMRVHRALREGQFPSARKLNAGGLTSPWLIPKIEAERWLGCLSSSSEE